MSILNPIEGRIRRAPKLETAESECEALLWKARAAYLRTCPDMIAETREVARNAPDTDPRLRLEAIRTTVAVGQSLKMPAPPAYIDNRQVHLSIADREFLAALGLDDGPETEVAVESDPVGYLECDETTGEEELPPWERDPPVAR